MFVSCPRGGKISCSDPQGKKNYCLLSEMKKSSLLRKNKHSAPPPPPRVSNGPPVMANKVGHGLYIDP